MAVSRVASRYVKSLLGLAVEQGALEEVHQDMLLFDKVCKQSRDFVVVLKSPVISHEIKRSVLIKLFQGKVHALTLAIFEILTRKNREPILPEIAEEFHASYNVFQGIEAATLTTTFKIDQPLRTEVEAIVKKLSKREKVELTEKIDTELIGGFILNVGDQQIDASIKNKLKSLRVKFSQNPYIAVITTK